MLTSYIPRALDENCVSRASREPRTVCTAHRTRTTGTGHGGRSRHAQTGGDSQGRWYDVRSYAHARAWKVRERRSGRASIVEAQGKHRIHDRLACNSGVSENENSAYLRACFVRYILVCRCAWQPVRSLGARPDPSPTLVYALRRRDLARDRRT